MRKEYNELHDNHQSRRYKNINAHSRRVHLKMNNRPLYRITFLISIVMLLVVAIGCLIPVSASDLSESKEPLTQYYTSISIETNDTLWDIAQEYNNGYENDQQYIYSIMQLNNMKSDTIYSGQYIVVYYFSPN